MLCLLPWVRLAKNGYAASHQGSIQSLSRHFSKPRIRVVEGIPPQCEQQARMAQAPSCMHQAPVFI
eukprot:1160614-Pelagomonas_calceolata.AAC.1